MKQKFSVVGTFDLNALEQHLTAKKLAKIDKNIVVPPRPKIVYNA